MKKIYISLFSLFVAVLVLSGCGNTDSPKGAVENGLKGIKNRNVETVERHFTEPEVILLNDMNGTYIDAMKPLMSNQLNHKVLNVKVNGDTAVVEVEFENIDFINAYKKWGSETNEWVRNNPNALIYEVKIKFLEIFEEIFSDKSQDKIFTIVELDLTKKDNEWVIFSSAAMFEAMYPGGMLVFLELNF